MFKKISMIMGLMVLFLGLTACDDSTGYDAFELFERSQEVMEDIDSMIMELDLTTEVLAAGISNETEMNFRMSVEMLNDTEANVFLLGSTMGIELEIYFRDGYMYTDVMGERNREAMDFEDIVEMTGASLLESTLDVNLILSSSVERIEDGGYRLNFTLDPIAMFESALGDNIAGVPFSGDMIDEGALTMVFHLDEEYYLTHAEVDMDVTFSILGETGSVMIRLVAEYIQLGDVTVEFPAWVDEFNMANDTTQIVDLQAYLDMVRAGGEGLFDDMSYDNVEVGEGNELIITLEKTAEEFEELLDAFDVNDGIGWMYIMIATDYRNYFGVDHFRWTFRIVDINTGNEFGRHSFDSE